MRISRAVLMGMLLLQRMGGAVLSGEQDEAYELDPLAVETARRASGFQGEDPLGMAWELADDSASGRFVDDWLAASPAFSLFRRDSVTTAHPTTQGVSLRQLGPSAASRTLVLKDGIPQNDPFGGWVPWTRIVPGDLASLELLPATQATAWGPLTGGGAILLESLPLGEDYTMAQLGVGAPRGLDLQFGQGQGGGSVDWAVAGRIYESDGDWLVHPEDRGAIDRRGNLAVRSVEARFGGRFSDTVRWSGSAGYFEEERGNGSPLARNETEGWEAALRFDGASPDGGVWQGLLYYQSREFINRFTVLSDDRTTENPVLDQFSIPSRSVGGGFVWHSAPAAGDFTWSGGLDTRWLDGHTHEDFSFGLDDRRKAGGEQLTIGAFGRLDWAPNERIQWELMTRLDGWAIADGFRRETFLTTGAIALEESYADRLAIEGSAALRGVLAISEQSRLRIGLARSFRLPTINELYRPYRVGVDVFGANPDLEPERFTTLELSFERQLRLGLEVTSGIYLTEVEDGIANLRRFEGPGPSDAGFVPAGGTYHRRENVDRSFVRGWESALEWRFRDHWTLAARGVWQEATFEEVALDPSLEGHRFPLTPDLRGSVTLEHAGTTWGAALTASGDTGQFDDAVNTRSLPAILRWDARLWWQWTPRMRLSLDARNLTDRTILTGRASDGERSIAPGRSVWVSVEWRR